MPDSHTASRDLALSRAQAQAMTQRADLLEREARIVRERRQTWAGRLRDLGDYGRMGGGSAGDRRLIVEAMAALEGRGGG